MANPVYVRVCHVRGVVGKVVIGIFMDTTRRVDVRTRYVISFDL